MRARRAAALAAAMLALAGCAATRPPAPEPPAARPLVALLPLENLSGQADAGARMTRVVFAALGRSQRFTLVEPGDVDAALADLRVRSAGLLTRDQAHDLMLKLGTRWILAGTLLEAGQVRTPDGDTPTVAIALRLVDGRDARVVWAGMQTRSGEDRETVFAWGRVNNLEALAAGVADELARAVRLPEAAGDTVAARGR